MLRGLMSMSHLDVLDLDDIIAVIGFNDQMNGKKQVHGIINDRYIDCRKNLCRKLCW